VLAVCHLVASAVEGLAPDGVSVLDMNGNLLSRPRRSPATDGEESSEAALDYRRQVEKDLVLKITSTLEPLLGPEKFRAGASVECDFSGGEQSEETYDPTRSVMVSKQKTEDGGGAAPASVAPGTAPSATRRSESIAYQSSRLVRRTRLPQGTVTRISLSVLLDQEARWQGSGPLAKHIIEPPSPEKVKVIRDLVAAATGLNTGRGDQLIVESLPFEATLSAGQPGAPAWTAAPAPQRPSTWFDRLLRQENPVLLGVAAGVALLMLLAACLFFAARRKRRAVLLADALVSQAEQQPPRRQTDAEALESLKLPRAAARKSEALTKHLVETARKDPAAAAQILRSWLYD
jgi:flagellar M-ring protein FliF